MIDLTYVKPLNCNCLFPDVIARNMSGHDPACPAHLEFEKNILEDIKHCQHVMGFVSSSHFIGEGETGKDEIRICMKCGLLIVDGERNFRTYHLSIRIMTRAHLEAIERFIKLIESEA